MKPLAKKKARQISHGIGSPKPEKAATNGSVLVRTETPNPNMATAPSGNGCVMIPTMVPRKIANSCHAFRVTPSGTGTNQSMTPVAIDANRGFIAAPCHGCAGGVAGAGVTEAEAEDEALTVRVGRFKLESGKGDGEKEMEVWWRIGCLRGLKVVVEWRSGGDLGRRRRDGRVAVVSAMEAIGLGGFGSGAVEVCVGGLNSVS